MQNDTYTFFEEPGRVFATHIPDQTWFLKDEFRGVRVGNEVPQLEEICISFYFLLPSLPPLPGVYNILTLARGQPGKEPHEPDFWNPVRLAAYKGGVYACITYDAYRQRFGVRMNAGGASSRLCGVFLEALPPEVVANRVLRLAVWVSSGGIHASLDADEDLGPELFADQKGPGTGRLHHPWQAKPKGHWWLTSGVGEDEDEPSLGFPAGFALSDLRVLMRSRAQIEAASLPYSGALEPLLREAAEEPLDTPPLSFVLSDVSSRLRELGARANAWSIAVDGIADEAEVLAEALPRESGEAFRSHLF